MGRHMIADFSGRLTFAGTLDGSVERYPWDRSLGLPELRCELITDVIYGKKLLINDGYLAENSALARELRDIGTSLLGNLLREGDARLFARDGLAKNIAEGIEKSASEGVQVHRALLKDPDWPALRNSLEYLSRRVSNFTIPWPEDKNIGELFAILIARVSSMHAAERASIVDPLFFHIFDEVHRKFDAAASRSSYTEARATWEACCWEYFGKKVDPLSIIGNTTVRQRETADHDYANVRKLMNVANEVYHLACAIGAGHAIKTENPQGIDTSTVGVSTALVTAFPDLISAALLTEESMDLLKVAALNRLLIAVPSSLDFKGDYSFIARFRGNDECRIAGQHYLDSLKKFIMSSITETECANARAEYDAKLRKIMAPAIEPEWPLRMEKHLIDLLKMPIGFALDVPLHGGGKFLGMVIGELGPKNYNMFKIIERLFTTSVEARVAVALAEPGNVATQSADSYKLVRRLGLYVGPLNPDGITQVAKQAKTRKVSTS
jgi:hypothetical protein